MAFSLPSLPYAFDALEPNIDKATMEIHYGKHHNAYVTNLNNAIAGTDNEGPTTRRGEGSRALGRGLRGPGQTGDRESRGRRQCAAHKWIALLERRKA